VKHVNICFIGNGSHAERIKIIISNMEISYDLVEYDRVADIEQQANVLNSDIIFITSPNSTHANYLNKLSKSYKGYVFCEKPPINKFEDLEIFDMIDPCRFFFGFNHRYSEIQDFISNTEELYNMGDMVNINIHMSYPFSVKESYKYSWKSDISKSPCGVIENLGIHYIDLSVTLLGRIKQVSLNSVNINKSGSAADTATICLVHEGGSTSQIFVSYATLARESMYFSFERGDISYNGSEFNTYYPRETVGKNGLSICPPIVLSKSIDSELLYYQSLHNCINYFINIALSNDCFNHSLIDRARISTLAMFGRVQ
jgi:predicted dehydrogenase